MSEQALAGTPPLRRLTQLWMRAPALSSLVGVAQRHPRVFTLGLATLLVGGDFLTGVEIAFTLLYMIPIALAVWWRARGFGVFLSIFCAIGAFGVELAERLQRGRHLHPLHMIWDHGGSFVLFVFLATLVDNLRRHLDREASERRLAVEQLRQSERLGVVGRLAAGLAHELGTPLNVIVGHAELLESSSVMAPTIQKASATILAQTEKMTAIIRGLLDFSRQAGSERSDVDLDQLTKDAAVVLHPVAEKKAVESARDGRALVHGNRTELEQVLVNLMMNGIQAMPEGGTLRVRVHAHVDDPEARGSTHPPTVACLEVEDEGVGISPESLPRIFDPFFTTKEVGEGTGLGLSVAYGIVSDHGGRIRVASSLGAGSRFYVYLPVAAASS